MPYTYHIEPPRRLVIAVGTGACDLSAALATLRTLTVDSAFEPDFAVLVDLRAARYTPTAEEAGRLADFYASPAGLRGHRVARVVSRMVDFGVGNMIGTLAEMRGGEVR